MAEKNFTIKHSPDGSTFDTLYPETTISQVKNLQSTLNSKQDDLTEIQSFANNKYLHSNSSTGALEWADADALPPQSGHQNQFLKTNGTAASWSDVVVTNTASLTLVPTSGTLTYVLNHGLNTRNIAVQVYDAKTYETIICNIKRVNDNLPTDNNYITVEFSELPEDSEGLHNCIILCTAMSTSSISSGEEVYY